MSPGQDWFVREFAETLQYELGLQGVPASLHIGGFPDYKPDRVYALMEPREYLRLEGTAALPDDPILQRTVFICTKRPSGGVLTRDVALMQRAGAVFDIEQRSVLAMRRAGIAARALKPGYSALRDCFAPEAERPIDVLFLGVRSSRRTHLLSRYADMLARRNCLVQIADDGAPNSTGSSSYLTDAKWALLAQAKVVINLHRDDEPFIEWLRLVDAVHAGAVVVSEHASGLTPLVAGQHLLVASPESLPYVVDAALSDPGRLAGVREQAYERLKSWLPFALSVAVLRAAAVELVGNPVAPRTSLGRPCCGQTEAADRWEPGGRARDGASSTERELLRTRRDVIELHDELTRLEQFVQSGQSTGPRVQVVYESPAWAARRAPRVTVAVALSHQAEHVRATLDSVAASWLRDLELVVVGSPGSDDAWAAAAGWMRGHPRIPTRLVALAVDRGRGAALNAAVDMGRGPLVLILDPDDELYPRCLDVLTGTLDAMPTAAMAYPITDLDRRDRAPAARTADALTSFYGWEPRRLRLGNPIRGPVLIRTARLRELGGFAADVRLRGWEDYDLWCRLAERGWAAQLVPQILARHHGPPPVLDPSLRAVSPAMALMAERAPSVLDGVVGAI